jgi:hypothetical protein
MRVIDADFTVRKQNTDMKKLTGVDLAAQEVKCHEHLSCPDCQTDPCPLNQLQDELAKTELHDGDGEVIVREITGELPDGETKPFSMVVEPITDESGAVTKVIQSFKDLSELKSAQELPSRITVPEPTDAASFRRAFTELLNRAADNGVSFANRSWVSSNVDSGRQWDVVIASVQSRHDEEN